MKEDHWFSSTCAFTIIIHTIVYKLFIETAFWNTISGVMCFCCLLLYYVVVILGNLNIFAIYFQP